MKRAAPYAKPTGHTHYPKAGVRQNSAQSVVDIRKMTPRIDRFETFMAYAQANGFIVEAM
tara:strand:- start:480 stop:659 length:180 start_codon:yes stop_codon:yes gene_type:complete